MAEQEEERVQYCIEALQSKTFDQFGMATKQEDDDELSFARLTETEEENF